MISDAKLQPLKIPYHIQKYMIASSGGWGA